MKANAPEKIYLQENTTTDCYGEWWPEWFEARAKDSDIEYTRTDAFIEKAVEWLKENKDKCLYNTGERGEYIPTCSTKMIEDFAKYMGGE